MQYHLSKYTKKELETIINIMLLFYVIIFGNNKKMIISMIKYFLNFKAKINDFNSLKHFVFKVLSS